MVIFHSYVTVYQEGTPWYPHHNFLKSPRISGISLRLAESTPASVDPSALAQCSVCCSRLQPANGERRTATARNWRDGVWAALMGTWWNLYIFVYESIWTCANSKIKIVFFFLMAMCLVQTFLLTSTSAKHLHEKGITLPCSLQSTDSQIK